MIKRVLILIHHKHKLFWKQAEFHYYLTAFVEKYPKIDFIIPVPKIRKELPKFKNLFYFEANYYLTETGYNRIRHIDEVYIDKKIIDKFITKWASDPVDVIFTEKPMTVPSLMMYNKMIGSNTIPIVVVEPYLKSELRGNIHDNKGFIQYSQTLGYLLADLNLFQTDWETMNAKYLLKRLFFKDGDNCLTYYL